MNEETIEVAIKFPTGTWTVDADSWSELSQALDVISKVFKREVKILFEGINNE